VIAEFRVCCISSGSEMFRGTRKWTIKRRSRAGPYLYRPDPGHVSGHDRLRALLRADELRSGMDFESIVMLAVSVLMMIYLAYALLRPEKF
jgi:K+-transporting ATPase KdpF subunit